MNVAASSINRQLELTLNALCRSFRRVLRAAEREDPTGTGVLWEAVEHRSRLLKDMLSLVAKLTELQDEVPAACAKRGLPQTVEPARRQVKEPAPRVSPQLIAAARAVGIGSIPIHGLPPVQPAGEPNLRRLQMLTLQPTALEPRCTRPSVLDCAFRAKVPLQTAA